MRLQCSCMQLIEYNELRPLWLLLQARADLLLLLQTCARIGTAQPIQMKVAQALRVPNPEASSALAREQSFLCVCALHVIFKIC
jgi:hypothetical protein